MAVSIVFRIFLVTRLYKAIVVPTQKELDLCSISAGAFIYVYQWLCREESARVGWAPSETS